MHDPLLQKITEIHKKSKILFFEFLIKATPVNENESAVPYKSAPAKVSPGRQTIACCSAGNRGFGQDYFLM